MKSHGYTRRLFENGPSSEKGKSIVTLLPSQDSQLLPGEIALREAVSSKERSHQTIGTLKNPADPPVWMPVTLHGVVRHAYVSVESQ